MSKLREYLPALSVIFATVLAAFGVAQTDNKVTTLELIQILLLVVGGVATYIVPRAVGATWLKPFTAFLFAGLSALYTLLHDGQVLTLSNWVVVILAALSAIGVTVTNRNVPITTTAAVHGVG